MSSSTVTIVVALISAITAIIVALIQTRKDKEEPSPKISLPKQLPAKKKLSLFTMSPLIIVVIALLIIMMVNTLKNQQPPMALTDTQIASILNNATKQNYDYQSAVALFATLNSSKATATFQSAYETVAAADKLTRVVAEANTQLAIQKAQTQDAISGTIVANSTAQAQASETAIYQMTKSEQDSQKSIQETSQAVVKTQEAQASATQAAKPPIVEYFLVDANKPWVNSGIHISIGDTVTIERTYGQWRTTTDDTWRDGFNCSDPPCGVSCIAVDAPEESLIIRVGTAGKIFCAGKSPFTSPQSGYLLLSFNDAPNMFSDNQGQINVRITVKRK
ncbi:MAG TPA: hypothetical protein VFF14_09725 [Candidatus Deferrimicrobium sp.]|nr:hypothetical protein [Candidatus Deferrimicrobium sp.]